ncbi:hypothetical protein ARALYDRAFT_345650 [Arabidopsis lyrata subsp. lyrata]|uniref:Uncharacterized protein n=2 Tax=Arabidopsis lyrata subsp. lyrata TaxID=81972 RepID=D7LBQ6_ARALL|nr:UPF0725 protein At3g25080 isoform X2 [Arabidopsis lyrata subsp. lyrata]EFH56019.1 hypothetical protein ARALYDRAFT_345650 [Arabidopsis lyrata subsp. lyrata]|eukprot:XP_002879760.1 UPF0725 protein At3g25080 isoform X2 [Arabidopsis lyrata subsp. lyrata]
MGLHRYNLLKGENYQFVCVQKYHYRLILAPSTYFITVVATDPSTSLPQTFHIRIEEDRHAAFILKCNISRIQGEFNKFDGGLCYPGNMPEWPTEDPFDNGKRFYVLNDSELQDNEWIRLYLELAVTKHLSTQMDPDLSELKIVNAAIDIQVLNEGLNAINATVYISYKDSCEARVGKDVDRIAIVRRNFDERTGCFTLMGMHQSSETIPKKGANQSEAGVGKDVDNIRRSYSKHTSCQETGFECRKNVQES